VIFLMHDRVSISWSCPRSAVESAAWLSCQCAMAECHILTARRYLLCVSSAFRLLHC
jgi:hypothetical protein